MGCRTPLAPNIDRNKAPETWITAAPFDTITVTKGPFPQLPKTIPVRFHVYWAGSDQDGAVAGFYWAVVETLPRPPEGQFFVPNLPGPKPSDYHFTTKTDSIFIFNVAEDVPDRQHAFFVYSIDNNGKPDPTPARFIFNALDRFPPIPIFDEAKAVGTVYELDPSGPNGVRGTTITVHITDTQSVGTVPRDTVPSGSALFFKWHGQPAIPGSVITGYRYKLDEPQLVEVGPEVTHKEYNSANQGGDPADSVAPAPGTKVFVLRVVDQAHGTRDSTRRFQYNFSPVTWFAGPDPNGAPFHVDPQTGEKYLFTNEVQAQGIPGSLLGPDSTQKLPAARTERKTFFEIWQDKVYMRSERDTVHMNSWLLFHGGGFDKDSRYLVNVSDLARTRPDFPGGPVLTPGDANGSPVAFRPVFQLRYTGPANFLSVPEPKGQVPIFDPNSVFNNPRIGVYTTFIRAGRAYALLRAIDGDGAADGRVTDAAGLADRVDAGGGTPEDRELRNQVLVFYTDYPPELLTNNPLFRPSTAKVDTFCSTTWDLRLIATDSDPYQANAQPGGPSQTETLRRQITVYAGPNGNYVWSDPGNPYVNQQDINTVVPSDMPAGPITIEVQLCDCAACENEQGTGRCITVRIPAYYLGPTGCP